jgi:hypothetical protein
VMEPDTQVSPRPPVLFKAREVAIRLAIRSLSRI